MANVFGTDNDDTIDSLDGVTNSADTIYGKDGDDTIFGLGGDDTIFAGDGNDWVIGGDGEDNIFGNAGNDALKGGGGADHLDGGSGNDTLGGGSGADALNGGTGTDTVNYNDPLWASWSPANRSGPGRHGRGRHALQYRESHRLVVRRFPLRQRRRQCPERVGATTSCAAPAPTP